jgi:hypothetical protein
MAKKVRRVRRSSNIPDANPPLAEPKPSTEEQLREEYAYVLKDLRRVAIVAVAMFALLILLNLLLR